jgi:hypothetical protein
VVEARCGGKVRGGLMESSDLLCARSLSYDPFIHSRIPFEWYIYKQVCVQTVTGKGARWVLLDR